MAPRIDDDLLDDRIRKAMELRRERKTLANKIQKMDESYRARRKPHDDRIESIDVAMAELIVVKPTATEPPAETSTE